MISFTCPHCQKNYQWEESYLWKEAECVNCKERFTISLDEVTTTPNFENNPWKRRKQFIILFVILLFIILWLFGTEYYKKWSLEKALEAPVNLKACIDLTKKLRTCEAFTCEYDTVNAFFEWKIHNNYIIAWSNENCELKVETSIDKKPYTNMTCSNLTSPEIGDLAYDYDIMLASKWTSFSIKADLGGKAKTTIDNKVLKDTLNNLLSVKKCSIQFQ